MLAASSGFACGADRATPDAPTNQRAEPTTSASASLASSPPNDASAPSHALGEGGGLSPFQVRRVVMSHTGALRACYETVASSNPDLRGGVSVAWDIDPQGTVHHARVIESTISEPKIGDCVARQIASWQFDASDKPTFIAQYPYKFGVGQKDAGAQ